ncbi:hypothetical protein ACJ2A9_04955 [Anaerobacillus sp. MEB173]|uniref:hypothetical protein n=1 Tax=Anaerobacillus sp. MEB173 TaxID=3383345 RepID=UPI003F915980
MVSGTKTNSTHITINTELLFTNVETARKMYRLSPTEHAICIVYNDENALIALSVEQAEETAHSLLELCQLIKQDVNKSVNK